MQRLMLAVLFATLSASAIAQDQQPKSIADLERDEFLLGGTLWERVERISKEKTIQCLKAFPHEQFCACLGNQLPLVVTVAKYAAIVATPRKQLDSAAASDDERKLIEVTLAAREKCAKSL